MPATGTPVPDRYLVISSDCHAGASLDTYREYLEQRYLEEFDDWRGSYVNPFEDLQDEASPEYRRNFETPIRQAELERDGIVGEVVFPNTIPPFFPGSPLTLPEPRSAVEWERRWAGLRAHNRWLADWCGELPGRRAGVAQVLLDDVPAAVAEVRSAKEARLFGGVLIPNLAPDSALPPLHAPDYEPLWATCAELGVPINVHGGTGVPDYGPYFATPVLMYVEFGWYAQRPFLRLLFSGVFERHPDLRFVMTEQGGSWVPGLLDGLDWAYTRMRDVAGSVEQRYGGPVVRELSLKPSEYWARQCYLGASFMSPEDCAVRSATGVDRIMWGSDYPHDEGTAPHTMASLRLTFAGVDPGEVRRMLGLNAAEAYGFDRSLLEPLAAELGPLVADVAEPLHEIPEGAISPALSRVPKPIGNIS